MTKKRIQLLKYIQMLLAVNFCLTAVGIANAVDTGEANDDSNFVFVEDEDDEADFEETPVPSSETTLDNQFNQIWDSLATISRIHQENSLQEHALNYQKIPFIFTNETPEEVFGKKIIDLSGEVLDLLPDLLNYEIPGEMDGDTVLEIHKQRQNISDVLSKIIDDYQPLSTTKDDKAFISYQLEEITNFIYSLLSKIAKQNPPTISPEISESLEEELDTSASPEISESLEEELDTSASPEISESLEKESDTSISLDIPIIQELLENCKDEDDIIYKKYETVINTEKANIKRFLANHQAYKNTFLYFNKDENLIEINHTKDGKNICTTVWQIRSSDRDLVTWNKNDPISIKETGVFSKFSIYGERLDYTLTNNTSSSVRANFLWKSTPRNTYIILDVNHYENTVLLEKGLSLFVIEGNLEAWHAKDVVILEKSNSSLDAKVKHNLINTIRNKRVTVLLTK